MFYFKISSWLIVWYKHIKVILTNTCNCLAEYNNSIELKYEDDDIISVFIDEEIEEINDSKIKENNFNITSERKY